MSAITPVLSSSTNDFLGDRFSTAYNIGNISGNYTFTWNDSVSTSDAGEYFRFQLGSSSNVRVSLTGLTGDADLRLLSGSGVELGRSDNAGSRDEAINQELGPGIYYVQVFPYNNATTNYRLGIVSDGTGVDPGNTLATALDFGEVSRSYRSNNNFVGTTDVSDYYRFEVRESTSISLTLSNLGADADVRLLDIGGVEIARSQNANTDNELINWVLNPGVYYALVYGFSSTDSTNYLLRIEGNQYVNPSPRFNATYGYGLVNAAAAVATAVNQPTFADVSNLVGDNWGNDVVNAPEVWARGYTGQGVTVAVIDSGVDIFHPDLINNIWVNTDEILGNGIDDDGNGYVDDRYGWNFGQGQNNNNVLPGTPGNGHGTHVAGTIAAMRNGVGMTGVAPDARIMAIRMGDVVDGGFTNAGNLAQAIRYAVDNGARVINMSLSWSNTAELRDALAYAANRNVIVVSSAGNNAVESPGNPGFYAINSGIVVGAINQQSQIAGFSNRASTDSQMRYVVAPGVDINSTYLNNTYQVLQGTSMAAPHVAGVIALMLSANPNLTHAQVRQILTGTTTILV